MKKKKIPEQRTRAIQITKNALIASMRRLLNNEDFKLLRGQWLNLRGKILEDGKEKPNEGQWFVLKGFDTAIMEPEKWASIETREDEHKKMAAELQARLTVEK